jgi:lysophospholipase L1-like esterase
MGTNFTTIDTFKFWCQKILPLAYDDSLSYYETLCKLTSTLNKVIENVNNLPDYIAELLSDVKLNEILKTLLNTLEEQIASANEKNSETATDDRNVGDYVWLNGLLYRVIKQVDTGDKYVVNSNIEKITIESSLKGLEKTIASYIEVNQTNASKNITKDELVWFKNMLIQATKNITVGTSYVENVNYIVVTIEQLIKNEKTARENNDNTILQKIEDESNARKNADEGLQSNIDNEINARKTADDVLQSNIDNEINARKAADEGLQNNINVEATNRENTDNAINSKINTTFWYNKKILVCGDSISDEINVEANNWVKVFRDLVTPFGATVKNISLSGMSMTETPNRVASEVPNDASYDIVIMFLGTNDFNGQHPMGNYGDKWTVNFSDAIRQTFETLSYKINRTASWFWITPLYRKLSTVNAAEYPISLDCYRASIKGFAKKWGCNIINGDKFPNLSEFTDSIYLSDGLHPTTEYYKIMGYHIKNVIESGGEDSYNVLSRVRLENANLHYYFEDEKMVIDYHNESESFDGTNSYKILNLSPLPVSLLSTYNAEKHIWFDATLLMSGAVYKGFAYIGNNSITVSFSSTIPQGTGALDFKMEIQPVWCNIAATI